MSLISIIMPVRNTAQFLEQTLISIINQTYKNWELITVNNCSEDNSLQILEHFAAIDNRIKVYQNTNSDLIQALQLAYSKSMGDFVTRMDSDDLMPNTRLEKMKNTLITNPNAVCTGYVTYFSDDELGMGFERYEKWLNNLSSQNNNFSEIYKECVIPSPCWMISRENFEKCGGFNSNIYPEDYDLCFRFYKNNLQVITVKETMLFWRDYSTRNSRTDPNYSNQLFYDLKLKYFFKLDYNPAKKLAVWGVGKKGKSLVRKVKEYVEELDWVSDNPNKLKHNIYGVIIQKTTIITINHQVLIAVSNEIEQKAIENYLKNKNIENYLFC